MPTPHKVGIPVAVSLGDDDLFRMKQLSIAILAAVWMLVAATGATAQQLIPPGGSQFNPLNAPLPPPPPSPKIEAPVIPQMDAPPTLPSVQSSQRGSFSDRITECLDEGAAAGLGPNARAAYSRSCANQ